MSLRLVYSAKQAKVIEKSGLKSFFEQSFDNTVSAEIPEFIQNSPKSFKEYQSLRRKIKSSSP
ncbi:MAG: hypothetical protein EXR18_07790 [Flavobacteriaceae bacterium]|nr:hypothetical protein [Flavobacteriaceae bacterium]